MTIKYDMKITDKDLAGKEILNTATAVSDEALKVTTDETVIPDGPNPKVEKEIDTASPAVGKDVTFTLTFTNPNQNTRAEDVKITDDLDQIGMVTIYANSMSVKLNNEDITDQVQITYNEMMDGFDMDTGLDLTEDDIIVVTYRAKVLPEAGDVKLVNTAAIIRNGSMTACRSSRRKKCRSWPSKRPPIKTLTRWETPGIIRSPSPRPQSLWT